MYETQKLRKVTTAGWRTRFSSVSNIIKPLPHVEFQIVEGYSRAKVHFRWAVWTLVQLELVWNGNTAFGILFSEYLIPKNIVFESTQEGAKNNEIN